MVFVLQSVKLFPELDPMSTMAVHFGLGLANYKLSSYETAMLHFLKMESVAKEEEERKGETANLSLVSYYLAELEYTQNKFLSAAGYFEISAKSYTTKEVDVGTSLYNVHVPSLSSLYCKCGNALRYGSKVMEAIKAYWKGAELASLSRDSEDELSAHTSLGNLYQNLGEFGKAVEEYQETLKLSKQLQDFVSLGWAHGNLGNAYLGLGKREKALGHLKSALNLTLEHEPVPQAIGRAYNNLGTAYQSLNDYDMAREYYELGLNQAIYGNDLPGQARLVIGGEYVLSAGKFENIVFLRIIKYIYMYLPYEYVVMWKKIILYFLFIWSLFILGYTVTLVTSLCCRINTRKL